MAKWYGQFIWKNQFKWIFVNELKTFICLISMLYFGHQNIPSFICQWFKMLFKHVFWKKAIFPVFPIPMVFFKFPGFFPNPEVYRFQFSTSLHPKLSENVYVFVLRKYLKLQSYSWKHDHSSHFFQQISTLEPNFHM